MPFVTTGSSAAVVHLSTRDAAPPVRVAGASLTYRGVPVFADLSAEFAGGSWTCILGPSGAGKSSLLRLIAGIAPDARGLVGDGDGRPLRGRVAFMDQRDLLLPWASAIDNVTVGARLRGERVDEPRAASMLAAVGLGHVPHLLPAQLSGGMRQRVALARTLMEDRPIVLMDEPFSAVDALTRIKLQELARRLLAGRTLIMVTHDPWEALRIGDEVRILAGAPARLSDAIAIAGEAPRDVANPALGAHYREMLARMEIGA